MLLSSSSDSSLIIIIVYQYKINKTAGVELKFEFLWFQEL